jgi:arginyl-tRNA synthetase
MGENLFDSLDAIAARGDGQTHWAARAPFRPEPAFDLMLVPRVPDWWDHEDSRRALEQIEAQDWVESVVQSGDAVRLRLTDEWVAETGAALEAGVGEAADADLAAGRRYAVYFWGANTTKALHIGHLRNLAIGNAIGGTLAQAGARVEHRSLICDVGRSMGEAMAGIVERSGEGPGLGPDGDQKSDHFVGYCYADYVKAGRAASGVEVDGAEDSVAREASVYDDKADELMMSVLAGNQEALELWSKTRAWVIAGQRKTLARLGVSFDKVIFESDFLPEVAELTNQGLEEGTLHRRDDGMVMYSTEREELEEMPLVRADGLPTQHMRALAYWAAGPELDDVTSLQVCGTEWVAHVTCRRKLMDALGISGNANGFGSQRGGGYPTHDVFHGMVARQKRAITSSEEGALLIDDLVEWLDEELATDPGRAAIRGAHPHPDRVAAQVALAFFLLQQTSKRVEFEPPKLLDDDRSLGWDLVRAQAQPGGNAVLAGPAAADPAYRFAVVQAQMYRVHLRSAVDSLDVVPLARYLSHFARWYREAERPPEVERVVQGVLDRGVRGLGLEGA